MKADVYYQLADNLFSTAPSNCTFDQWQHWRLPGEAFASVSSLPQPNCRTTCKTGYRSVRTGCRIRTRRDH